MINEGSYIIIRINSIVKEYWIATHICHYTHASTHTLSNVHICTFTYVHFWYIALCNEVVTESFSDGSCHYCRVTPE